MVPGVPCVDGGNWEQDLALCEYSVLRIIFLARIGPYIYKDVDRFRKGPVHELWCLKASQVSKVLV